MITAGAEKLSGSAGTMTGSATNVGSTMTTGTAKSGGASKGSGTGTGTAAAASNTGGAMLGFEPAMGLGVAGVVAVGLGAILL